MKCKCSRRSWLHYGIISGFLGGFLFFAFGVFIHSNDRSVLTKSNMNSQYDRAGTTR